MEINGRHGCCSTMKMYVIILALFLFISPRHSAGECTSPSDPFAIAPEGIQQYGSSVNDLGEVVWLQFDPVSGYRQIYSTTRGQMTFDPVYRDSPSLNNRGDVVWMQDGDVYGIISGQLTRITYDGMHYQPKINDFGEVVTTNFDFGTNVNQIHSSIRGQLTFDPVDHQEAAIDNSGDVVWTQMDPWGLYQIYKLPYGASEPTAVTDDFFQHSMAAISNSGEVIWAQGIGFNDRRIYSSMRGQLTGECPAGLDHSAPSVNSCGDITFTNRETQYLVYRMGTNAPCVSEPEPNNVMQEAVVVGDNSSVTGLLDAGDGDTEDWFTFTADAGVLINMAANWTMSAQNTLIMEIIDNNGQVLASVFNSSSPVALTLTAPYAGTYYIRYSASDGRFGYNLFLTLNHPPVVEAGADQTVMPNAQVTLTGSADDPDGTIISYLWTQIGGITAFLSDETSEIASFTAPGQSGILTFQLEATDNRGATTFDTVQVTVNLPPLAEAGPDQFVNENTMVSLDGSGIDEGTITAYNWVQVAGAPVFIEGTGTPSASFTAPHYSGILTFQLTVTDDLGATASDMVSVSVNLRPTASAGPDQNVRTKAHAVLDGGASSDPDGSITSYTWVQTQGTPVTLSGANTPVATFTAPHDTGTLVFQLTVVDDMGAASFDTVSVVVSRK